MRPYFGARRGGVRLPEGVTAFFARFRTGAFGVPVAFLATALTALLGAPLA